MKLRITISVILLCLAGLMTIPYFVSGPSPMSNYLTVSEVMNRPSRYEGQTITIRGWGKSEIGHTLLGCPGAWCECNQLIVDFILYEADIEIHIPDFQCVAGPPTCSIGCFPFDNHHGAYQFTGFLVPAPDITSGAWALTDIDIDAMYRLDGSQTDLNERMPVLIEFGYYP